MHEAVVGELLARVGAAGDYAALPERARVGLLEQELASARPLHSEHVEYSPLVRSELAVLRMLDVLAQDYVRTAQAKGLAPDQVLVGHALKNAAVPIVTIVGIGVALLISGAIVTETVFALPGIGRLTVDAILRRDYPIIQGVTLIFSAVYVLVNLAVDLSYALFDPRIRY